MMEKDKLRRADVFSGSIMFLFGLWVVHQATQMPMKDSWGGVKNVWFVSPALFPLFVGTMIALLGALLVFYLVGSMVMAMALATSMTASMEAIVAHAGDWLTLLFIIAYSIYAWGLIRTDAALQRRYRICMILALASPLLIGSAFKYLLLVPMPKEGLVVVVLDAIRYWDF